LLDLGDTYQLLGIEVKKNLSNHSLSLGQRQYVVEMLERFGMADCVERGDSGSV
jgi:hypothetical protein